METGTNVTIEEEDVVGVLPNGTCVPRTADEISKLPPQYHDASSAFLMRVLIRIPTWLMTIWCLYMAVMLLLDVRSSFFGCHVIKNDIATRMKIARTVAATFTAVVMLYNSIAFLIETYSEVNCYHLFVVENFLHWFNVSIIYTVLWLRQRIIYSQQSLLDIGSKVTSFFSYATVVMAVLFPINNSVIFAIGMNYCFEEHLRLCRPSVDRRTTYYSALTALEFVVPILLPTTLFGLFAWPLIRHRMTTTSLKRKGRRSILPVIKRIAIATFISLLTDIAAMICTNGVCNVFSPPVVRHASLFTNITCLIFSFVDWKKVLCPIKFGEKSKIRTTNAASQIQTSHTNL